MSDLAVVERIEPELSIEEFDVLFNKLIDFFSACQPNVAFPCVDFSTLGEGIYKVDLIVSVRPKGGDRG